LWRMRQLHETYTAPGFLSHLVREAGPRTQVRGGKPIDASGILCAEKDNLEVEFALMSKANPIGVAEYKLQSALPAKLRGKLPTAKQLEDALREEKPVRR
jgi:YhcG PDDEXK nuclease domain